jgi:hypothetical protein
VTRTRYSSGLGCGRGTWVGVRVDGLETKDGIKIACIVLFLSEGGTMTPNMLGMTYILDVCMVLISCT